MNPLQFCCPHCHGTFQIDGSSCGQPVACPHCAGVVQVPQTASREVTAAPEPPPPIQQEVPVQIPSEESLRTEPGIPFTAEDRHADPLTPPRTRRARGNRKLLKNLILWAVCAIILVIVLWILLARGPLIRPV